MKTGVLPAVALVLTSVAAGVFGAPPPAGATPAADAAGASSCAEVKALDPDAHDGEYPLSLGGVRVPVYCHAMAAEPTEYLSLPRTGADRNFAQYTAGGASPGTDVITHYTRIRIDPHPVSLVPLELRVNIADQTFATSTGELCHAGFDCEQSGRVTAMPYAVAMGCGNQSALGRANLDLTGTLFAPVNTFTAQGFQATGSADYPARQVVELTGGGFCGWTAPGPMYNPVNDNAANSAAGGWDLRLRLSLF